MGSYQRAVLNDNPIAYWRLNEPSGSSAIDCVGGNTGTITGAVLGQDGIVGGSMMLGSTAYVSFGTLSSLSTGVVSVEGWVNLRTKTGIRQCLVTSGESTNSGFVLAPVYESDTTRMCFGFEGTTMHGIM
jgi:hypothetical protein